jgi:hypothetical protein
MQVIDVTIVLDCGMTTVCAVLMVVMGMMRFVAGAHADAPRFNRWCRRESLAHVKPAIKDDSMATSIYKL